MKNAENNKEATEPIEIDDAGKISKSPAPEDKKPAKSISVKNESRRHRFVNWYKSNKKKSIPLTLLILLVLFAAIPWSRYKLAGLALKNTYNIEVVDSTAGTAISGADVSIGGSHATTNGSGKATLTAVKVGRQQLVLSKKYYKDKNTKVLVPILKQKNQPKFQLAATGRQVKISVKNLINHSSLADVNISVADISSKTDKSGSAIIVLPVGTTSEKATLSLDGFNKAEATVLVDDKTIKENNFSLTPSGKIYFLSKLSGKIDVAKTNLDGTERQTVLAGSGKEDSNNTVLLASRDWKYLALLSRREGGANPKLYLIDTTSSDKLSVIDGGNMNLNVVGWSNNNFIYQLTKNSVNGWEPHQQILKSYNAQNKQAIVLDQNDAVGANGAYAQEQFGSIYTFGNTVAYYKTWYRYGSAYYDPSILSGKSSGLYSIKDDGSARKNLKTLDAGNVSFITFQYSEPQEAYLTIGKNDNTSVYAIYNGAGVSDTTSDKIPTDGSYNTYLASPSGNQTFWADSRDGKNVLFLGDEKGENGKQIASLSDYKPYGWFSDDYLLVSKNSSELYIMSKAGIDQTTQPVKITDYHKPQQNFFGYGGGYGGI
jgi:hypothetical protein